MTDYEKTLIYKYTGEGYDSLNEKLREGKQDEYEDQLNRFFDKLPNFEGVVYRGINLASKQIATYQSAEKNNSIIVEKAFTSSTASVITATLYGNTIFSNSYKRTVEYAPTTNVV